MRQEERRGGRRLDPRQIHWLAWPETGTVMGALNGPDARRPLARFVGGAVRDALLGRTVQDIDIACALAPPEVTARLEAAGVKVIPTGLDHGTVTAVLGHRVFEVTTLRHDVETYGRRAKVAFTDDWRADAARRDFTINALYAGLDGALFDPFDGAADLTAGRVRFIGDARERIHEDALRILRFFRFHAWYGKGPLDPAGIEACRALVGRLDNLSVERVAKELLKLLAACRPGSTVLAMNDAGILCHVLPEARYFDRLERLAEIEFVSRKPDSLRRLAVLLPPEARGVGARLKLSGKDQKRLAGMIEPRDEIVPAASCHDLTVWLYRKGAQYLTDHALLNWAAAGHASGDRGWRGLVMRIAALKTPRFPLKGADVVARGVAPGPEVGDILAGVEAHWIAKGFPVGREQLQTMMDCEINRRKAGWR